MAQKAHRYTRAARAAAIEGFELRASNRGAAEAAGVGESTIRRWRSQYASFDAAAKAAIERAVERIGNKAMLAIEQCLDRQLAGERLPDRYAIVPGSGGNTVQVEAGGLYEVDTGKLRLALCRLDPRWTHPRQAVEHSGGLTLEQVVADIEREREAAQAAA